MRLPGSWRERCRRGSGWSWSGCWRTAAGSSPATGGPESTYRLAFVSQRGRGEEPMDFTPSPEVAELRERVLDFMDAEIYPQERELMEALDDEVGPGVPYPANLTAVRDKARGD